jgi:uncharacterized damage-inducible protein DinB
MAGVLDPEMQRIRGYLQTQGAKLTVPQLVDKLRADASQLHDAAVAVPAPRFDERPAAGEWSANEIMAHIVKSSDAFSGAIERVIEKDAPTPGLTDRIERDAPVRGAQQWWDEHAARRERLFAAVLAADADAHLDVMTQHPAFGDLNWRETLLFLRLHDIDHAGQLRQVAAALS